MINITMSDAIRVLDEIVGEAGKGFTYSPTDGSCQYLAIDESGISVPDCLIGHLFARMGVPIGEIRKIEGWSADKAIHNLVRDEIVNSTPEVGNFLRSVQRKQDAEISWGDALRYAKRWHVEEDVA